MDPNSRRKTLRPYNGKVIISENGQENFRKIRYFTYLTQKEGSLFTDNRKGLRCQRFENSILCRRRL